MWLKINLQSNFNTSVGKTWSFRKIEIAVVGKARVSVVGSKHHIWIGFQIWIDFIITVEIFNLLGTTEKKLKGIKHFLK